LQIDGSLEPLEEAYKIAKKKAKANDNDLDNMMSSIKGKLDTIKVLMTTVEANANNVTN